ncbi:hypothetical protein BVY03_00585 [bacterium K02(2017)]|nr:hypothetical protein BVY03_00585 [bacterium K02(2017)]
MKAILLAAGEGMRLRPLTNDIPKCLVPINNKPLLQHWLDLCEANGVTEVLINGHYLYQKVQTFIDKIKADYKLIIHFIHEEGLLGTGGTVINNFDFVKDEKAFFLFHGDNFTNIDLSEFAKCHHQSNSPLTVALFETNLPKQCGIAEEIADDGKIIVFKEKPQDPKSNLASAALFVVTPEVFKPYLKLDFLDFSKEILPLYQGKMYSYRIKGFNIDIGTLKNYQLAQELALAG